MVTRGDQLLSESTDRSIKYDNCSCCVNVSLVDLSGYDPRNEPDVGSLMFTYVLMMEWTLIFRGPGAKAPRDASPIGILTDLERDPSLHARL